MILITPDALLRLLLLTILESLVILYVFTRTVSYEYAVTMCHELDSLDVCSLGQLDQPLRSQSCNVVCVL